MQTTSTGRCLAVMRHSQAEQTASSDMRRLLTGRGHGDAGEAGRWLAGSGFVPDHVLVSSAERTRETWAEVAAATGWEVEPEFDTALYSAGPEAALDLLRLLPPDARSVLVIGHNPTVAFLAQMLDDGEGDPEAVASMASGFPTSAVAVLSYDGTWAELDVAAASLVAFHVGHS